MRKFSDISVNKSSGVDQAAEDNNSGTAVYIHWPYCLSKCPYCDFNSHVRPIFDEENWLKKIVTEINSYPADLKISSIFFGGGTPSLMSPQSTAIIIDTINKHFTCSSETEVTLEANPNSSESDRFKDFKNAGVNRISIGVQSFDQKQLQFLGRKHNTNEAAQAITNAQKYFDRVSFDLIYALPNQTLEQWEEMLAYALSFGTTHLSLYQLTIEPETPFETRYKRKEFDIPLDDASAQFYEQTVAQMTATHMPPYEVSNFAKKGQSCRHNLSYWHYADYIGVGPGAHGRFIRQNQKIHTVNQRAPETWLLQDRPKENRISETDQAFERLMMGLRLYGGIMKAPLEPFLNQQALLDLTAEGFLLPHPVRLVPTLRGILCHGSIVNYLLNDLT